MIENELIGPYEVNFDITNKCNMRCLHCYNFSGENKVINNEMSDEQLIKAAKEIRGLKPMNVCICGGEPLLRLEIAKKIILILKEENINVNMVSNGMLLNQEIILELEKCGLDAIQLSFDGIEEAYEKLRLMKGGYKKLLDSLKLLKNSKIKTCISITPTKWNKDQLDNIIEICKENNITYIRSQHLMPLGRGDKNFSEISLSECEYYLFLQKIDDINKKYDINFEWGDPTSIFKDGIKESMYIPPMYIKANGNVLFSPYIPITFGNVKLETLDSIIDKGFLSVLKEEFFAKLSRNINKVDDMIKIRDILVESFKEEDIYIEEVRKRYECR